MSRVTEYFEHSYPTLEEILNDKPATLSGFSKHSLYPLLASNYTMTVGVFQEVCSHCVSVMSNSFILAITSIMELVKTSDDGEVDKDHSRDLGGKVFDLLVLASEPDLSGESADMEFAFNALKSLLGVYYSLVSVLAQRGYTGSFTQAFKGLTETPELLNTATSVLVTDLEKFFNYLGDQKKEAPKGEDEEANKPA